MSRRSGTWVSCSLVTFAIVSALCVCGPAPYWRFNKSVRLSDSAASSCAPCRCNCPEPILLLQLPGLANLSVTDCGSNDPELKVEMEKQFVDLLTEELKLQEMVSEEQARHMNMTFLEAKRAASQYQKEAEKCNAATEICEGARECAEALLTKERKTTLVWEKRALNMGWVKKTSAQAMFNGKLPKLRNLKKKEKSRSGLDVVGNVVILREIGLPRNDKAIVVNKDRRSEQR